MTAMTELDRRVASWLETVGPNALDDEVVVAALTTARRLPRRHGVRSLLTGPADWPGHRPSVRLLPTQVRLAALVVLIAGGLVAVAAVGGRMLVRTPALPIPSAPPMVAPSATADLASPTPSVAAPTPDPLAHGRYTPAPDLFTPITSASVIPLPDGRVLIYGQTMSGGADSELFDPRNGEAVHVDLPANVISTALLGDGRVLMIGWSPDPTKPGLSVLFDPETGTTEPTRPQRIPRANAHLVALHDGRALMLGGEPPHADGDEQWTISQAELFDPTTASWSLTGSLHSKRFDGAESTILPDGRVLAVTAAVPTGLPVNVVRRADTQFEVFDPSTERWTRVLVLRPDSPHGGLGPSFALPDGRVAFVKTATQFSQSELTLWDPNTNGWSDPVTLPGALSRPVGLDDGRVYLLGAIDAFTTWSAIFDPGTGELMDTGPTRAWEATPALLADGRVLIVGGTIDGDWHETMGPGHRIPPFVATMEYFQ